MIRTRSRKILRDITSRKVRTILVSVSIFIGVLGVVTLFSTGEILVDQLRSDLQQDRLAMIRTLVTNSSGDIVDNETALATLRQLPGLTAVEGRAIYPLFWKFPSDDTFTKGFIAAHSEPFLQSVLEPPRLIEGEAPQPGQRQIAIERRMAERYDLKVGDTMDLRILSDSTGELRQETWTISGIVFQPYGEIGPLGPIDSRLLVFAMYEDAQYIAGFKGFSAILARYIDYPTAEQEKTTFLSTMAQRTPYRSTFTISENPAENTAIENAQATSNVLLTLALIALVVSGFLVVNVINSIVVEQKRQIGLLKTLGATRADNFAIYSGIALSYGLIGVIPGVLLGVPGGYLAAKGLATQNNTVIENFSISPTGIILGIVVGLAVPLLASVVPVFNGTRVQIREAMTDFGISATYHTGPLARLINTLPLPLTVRQAVNNVNQKKFRLALTGTTLTIAAAAFMGIFAVFSSLTDIVNQAFDTYGSHISVNPSQNQNYPELLAAIKDNVPGIRAIEPGARLAVEIEGYNPPASNFGPPGLFATGVNMENPDLLNLDLRDGTAWRDDPNRRGVAISARIADLMGKTAGDEIVILAGGNRASFEIIGVVRYPVDTIWFRWQDLSLLGGLTMGAPVPNQYVTMLAIPGYQGSLDGEQVTAVGMDEHTGAFLTYVEGGPFAPGEPQAIISEGLAERGDYQVGDTITVRAGDSTRDLTITGIVMLPPQLADQPDDMIAFFWRDLADLEGRSLSGEPYPNEFHIIMNQSDPTGQQAEVVINQINEVLLDRGITSEFTNWPDFNETLASFLLAFQIILYMAAALIAAVGAVGLLTSLSMSVFERQKEIGVMRSVGASSGTIALQFLIEGLTIGLAAWAIGVPLSFLLKRGLTQALNLGDTFVIGYPPVTLFVGLVGMVLIVTLASLLPSLAAARKTVSDILRYQ